MARRLAPLFPLARARTSSWLRHTAVDWVPEPTLFRRVGTRRYASRFASRFPTPVKDSRNCNVDLYDEVFRPMGCSMMQYERLMSFASKCKASEGSLVVKGGEPHTRFCLLTYGVAVAHKHLPESPGEVGPPICVYMGRLTPRQNLSEEVRQKGPVRGSVVGGSALVEPNVTSKAYPADIIAAEPTEWLEWDYDDLQRIIDAPGWRAVQASFYHLLYLELLGTLDRDRASRKTAEAQLDATKTQVVPENKGPPSTKQLAQLCLFVAVPFFGFGFADNAIMIVCGDFIDAQFGVMFGLTTMASAGLGNWLSDTIGLGLGDVIERTAGKMGLSNGNLSPAQERMQPAKLTTLAGKLIGITLGCFAGMVPLLFLKPAKVEIPKEDLEVYESTFMPYGVSTNAFVQLMKHAARRRQAPGHVMVKGGVPFPKVILLLRGEAIAIKVGEDASEVPSLDGTGDPTHKYLGRLEGDEPSSSPVLRSLCSHGSVVNGTAISNPARVEQDYPSDVIAESPVEYLEWEYKDLMEIMKEDASIQASIVSLLFHEMVSYVSTNNPAQRSRLYKVLMMAVLADGKVDESERRLLNKYRESHRISEQEHLNVLEELDWTEAGWRRGWMHPENFSEQEVTENHTFQEAALELEKVHLMLGQILMNLRPDPPKPAVQ